MSQYYRKYNIFYYSQTLEYLITPVKNTVIKKDFNFLSMFIPSNIHFKHWYEKGNTFVFLKNIYINNPINSRNNYMPVFLCEKINIINLHKWILTFWLYLILLF